MESGGFFTLLLLVQKTVDSFKTTEKRVTHTKGKYVNVSWVIKVIEVKT